MDLVDSESGTGCHHKAGAIYQATCVLCERLRLTAEYIGESGDSGYTRGLQHLEAIRNQQTKKSALAKHLREYHPENNGNCEAFKTKILGTFRKPLERQITEGVKIHNSRADILINDKEEWVQPAVVRMQATQEVAVRGQRRGRGVN